MSAQYINFVQKWIVLMLCILGVGIIASAQNLQTADKIIESSPDLLLYDGLRPQSRSFSPKDYHGSGQVWCINQDSAGLMYFANSATGLIVFDGFHWEKISLPEDDALISFDFSFYTQSAQNNPDKTNGNFSAAFGGAMGNFGVFVPDSIGLLQYVSLNKKIQTENEDLRLMLQNNEIRKYTFWRTHALQDDQCLFNSQNKLITTFNKDKINLIYNANGFSLSYLIKPTRELVDHEKNWKVCISNPPFNYKSFNPNNQSTNLRSIYLDSINIPNYFKDKAVYGIVSFSDKFKKKLNNPLLFVTERDGLFFVDSLINEKNEIYQNHIWNQKIPLSFAPHLKKELIYAKPYSAIQGKLNQIPVFYISTIRNGCYAITETENLLWHQNRESGLRSNAVTYSFFSTDENLWMTTSNGISMSTMNEPLVMGGQELGFEGSIQDIIRHKGKIHVATTQGVYKLIPDNNPVIASKLQNKSFSKINELNGQCWQLISLPYMNIEGKKDSDLVVAAGTSGLYILRGDSATKVSKYNSKAISKVYFSNEKLCKTIAVIGKNGFKLIVKNTITNKWEIRYNIVEFPGRAAKMVQSDSREGVITKKGIEHEDSLYFWIGTYQSGLIRLAVSKLLNGHAIMHFDSSGHIQLNSTPVFNFRGKLAFGARNGLFRPQFSATKGISIAPLTDIHPLFTGGLSTKQVFLLTEGSTGELWISYEDTELKCVRESNGNLKIDSIFSKSLNIGEVINYYQDPSQKHIFWIGGSEGIARFDASIKKDYKPKFPCLVRKVYVHNDSLLFGGYFSIPNQKSQIIKRKPVFIQPSKMVHHLPFDFNKVRFEYACPIYDFPEKVTYSWMLEGFNEKWSNWSKATYVEFTNLLEGRYNFRVKAKNVYGYESEEGSYVVHVLPPFHRSWWFYCLQAGVWILLLSVSLMLSKGHGKYSRWSVPLATVAMIVGFEYFQNIAEEMFINQMGGIIAIKTLFNTLLVFLLHPLERGVTVIIRRRQGMARVFKELLSGFYTQKELKDMMKIASEEGEERGKAIGIEIEKSKSKGERKLDDD